jgi:2-polyprenyl-3-methyl-5-hydroxy-6-metoxy-1,4-benzoquinol methylase
MSLPQENLAPPTRVKCVSCGKQASIAVARHGKWTYLACADCRSMELCPVPTEAELQRYYNTEYSVPCSTAYYRHYEGISRELLSVIEAHAKTRGTLLEIGCSHGAFLLPARAAGWQVTGIEISAEAASNARAHGLEVVTGTLEQCGSALGTFDCIVAWYVIEHLVDVDLFLDNIKHHLKPGGLLALRTANACALVARTIPQYWQWIDAPAHVRLFSPAGMAQLLARHSFSSIRQSTRRGDARTLGTDLLMAAAKTVVDRRAPSTDTLIFKGNGSRAGDLTRYTDLVFKPIDWILGIDGRNLLGAELFAMAKNSL